MGLETASYVANLVTSNPDGQDQRNTADDHIRLIKACLRRSFPQIDGAVSLSSVQFSYLNDVSGSVQAQLNSLRDGPATANFAVTAQFAQSASTAARVGTVLAANVAQLNQSATFVTDINVNKGSASLYLIDPSGGTDEKRWRLFNILGVCRLETRTDANLFGEAPISISRSGVNVLGIALTANVITLNGTVNGTISNATNAVNATNATNATSATNANFAQSASSASTLVGGYAPSPDAVASTVAVRTPAGYLYANYFNQGSNSAENPPVGAVMVEHTAADGFLRKCSIANFGTQLDARNITTKTGTTKTLSSSAPSGGSNGDIWYQY